MRIRDRHDLPGPLACWCQRSPLSDRSVVGPLNPLDNQLRPVSIRELTIEITPDRLPEGCPTVPAEVRERADAEPFPTEQTDSATTGSRQ